MQNIKLTPKQESFVKLANDEGFTTEITRKDIISLQSKHGITKPACLLYTSPSPRDRQKSRMPSSA